MASEISFCTLDLRRTIFYNYSNPTREVDLDYVHFFSAFPLSLFPNAMLLMTLGVSASRVERALRSGT